MNKHISTVLAGLLVIFILTGCTTPFGVVDGTSTPVSPKNTPTPDGRTPTPTKMPEIKVDLQSLDGLQITFLHPWSAETGRMMDILVDEFNQSNEWGIHVITQEPGSTGMVIQTLRGDDQSGKPINVSTVPIHEWLYQDQNQRAVVDLNPYVYSNDYGFTKEQVLDFSPAFWKENLVDGKLFAIPAQQNGAVLFYNTTWAAELGYAELPKSPAAMRLQLCAANATFRKDADRLNDGLGGWIVSTDADTLFSWLQGFETLDLSEPLETLTSKNGEAAFRFLYGLQKDACAWTGRMPESYDYFATRQALSYSGTTQDIPPQMAAFERADNTDEWKVISYPANGAPFLITDGLSFGVFESDDEHQLASWLFIKWLSQPVNQARLLQTTASLPLGSEVMSEIQGFGQEHPQWLEAVTQLPQPAPLPAQSNGGIIRTVLGDAGVFLFKPEFTLEQVPELFTILDQTIQELSELQP